MKKNSIWSTRTIAEIGIFAALGYVLDFLAGTYSQGLFASGGSIGIAMICVFIITYRRGFIPGILVGLIMGLLDIVDGFYAIGKTWYDTFFQIMLDYVVAYPLAAIGAGIFRRLVINANTKGKLVTYVTLGSITGGLLKFIAHFLSGVIFWGDDSGMVWSEFHGKPGLYSFLYNGAYMLPCIVICTILMIIICVYQGQILLNPNSSFVSLKKKENINIENKENY